MYRLVLLETRMKRLRVIFIDDGYPESNDYASNYIGYDPMDPADYRRAVEEALCRLCRKRGGCAVRPGSPECSPDTGIGASGAPPSR